MQQNTTTKHRDFRKLQDLNLIDNFLFQEMLSQENDGEEFARILLRTILGKPIRNVKIIPNIYDIEPNNSYEKGTLPKRTRYYHGLIDTQLLSSGSDYDKLPNVIIIMILPYDPFDKNRMVYTIRNQCEEDLSIPYDDGAKKIYLYTKGTEGKPSQSLKDMLKYIEKSTVDNITNSDIASVSKLVDKIKQRKGAGINYMKSWEVEKMARDEGYKEGFDDGFNDGATKGIEQINQLNLKLAALNRTDDIIKSAQDKTYRESLFKEFDL